MSERQPKRASKEHTCQSASLLPIDAHFKEPFPDFGIPRAKSAGIHLTLSAQVKSGLDRGEPEREEYAPRLDPAPALRR